MTRDFISRDIDDLNKIYVKLEKDWGVSTRAYFDWVEKREENENLEKHYALRLVTGYHLNDVF